MTEQRTSESSDQTSRKPGDNSYLQNQLLIAMPCLNDPYFKHSVTLICQHNEDGCFGLTINKPIEITVDEILKQLAIDAKDPSTHSIETKHNNSTPALRGGPVQIEQGFVIHDGNTKWENTLNIGDNLSVTASRDILLDIAAAS